MPDELAQERGEAWHQRHWLAALRDAELQAQDQLQHDAERQLYRTELDEAVLEGNLTGAVADKATREAQFQHCMQGYRPRGKVWFMGLPFWHMRDIQRNKFQGIDQPLEIWRAHAKRVRTNDQRQYLLGTRWGQRMQDAGHDPFQEWADAMFMCGEQNDANDALMNPPSVAGDRRQLFLREIGMAPRAAANRYNPLARQGMFVVQESARYQPYGLNPSMWAQRRARDWDPAVLGPNWDEHPSEEDEEIVESWPGGYDGPEED